MDSLKEFFIEYSFIINLASLMLGFAGVILAFIFYFRSKPAKTISSVTRSFKVITERSQKIPNLVVRINEKETSVVTLTRLSFWNSGNLDINFIDMAETNPLRLSKVNDANIFSLELNEQTTSSNQISLSKSDSDPNSYYIRFDYLNPGDGGSINIIHDGKTDNEFYLSGNIKGGQVKKTNYSAESQLSVAGPGGPMIRSDLSKRENTRFVSFAMACIGLVMLVIGSFIKKSDLLFIGPLMIIMGGVIFYFSRRLYPPIKIKSYDEDF